MVLAVSKRFQYDTCKEEIPVFWQAHYAKGNGKYVCGMYGINIDEKIFSECLPALKEYEFAAGYCVEMYDDSSKYPKGTMDENYHSEIWIPVKNRRIK